MNAELRATIQEGSKSFFLASLFFEKKTKQSCWELYQWCRYCDDQVDFAKSPSDARQALQTLRNQWSLPDGQKTLSFELVQRLRNQYEIPEKYFIDLLDGFQMDADGYRCQSVSDLDKYAYHVAGVVGIKMSYIMGLNNPQGFQNAVSLGIAMQLTNIARDVREDYLNDRVYLPQDWLSEAQLDRFTLLKQENQEKLYKVVLKLLDHADDYYQQGYAGLRYLPLRAAVAVSIAGKIYSEIGHQIRREGSASLSKRVIISFPQKILCTLKGIQKVLPLVVHRLTHPWVPVKMNIKKEIA